MLLSKRPEMFLPEKWPSYFSRSKGCKVWDLDGNEFIDTSMMGIGTNILGYGHPEVDEAVIKTVKDEIIFKDKSVKGFNLGTNIGKTSGQSILHCHFHLIPRRDGDVENPQGGVRSVIPNKQYYKRKK